MATINPEQPEKREWNWDLHSTVPLQIQLAHRLTCDEIDNVKDIEELKKCAKSYAALWRNTQQVLSKVLKTDIGFPTNIDGV